MKTGNLDLEPIKELRAKIDEARANLQKMHDEKFGTMDHRMADDELHGAKRRFAELAEELCPAMIEEIERLREDVKRLGGEL